MIVTFVSECEKNALKKTRRVLDAFASRIGSRTWQTIITEEGLQAVKKLLRRTATKNTAVSCHWIRSRSRTELLWIVGNREAFNSEGMVPVNSTKQKIINTQWENNWHYLPLMKALVALAGLFHDLGKASQAFQEKLTLAKKIADPLRHEWLSLLFLQEIVDGATEDETWLTRLHDGKINAAELRRQVENIYDEITVKKSIGSKYTAPLTSLPPAAAVIGWLIVSHHKMPLSQNPKEYRGDNSSSPEQILKKIRQTWGYENCGDNFDEKLPECFNFSGGLPIESLKWQRESKKWTKRMVAVLPLLDKSLKNGAWRPVLHHTRLCLMLADHHYSSQDADKRAWDNTSLYANSSRAEKGKGPQLNQKLSEHLVCVARQAVTNVYALPGFDGSDKNRCQRAEDLRQLRKKSSDLRFRWQDKAVEKISAWRNLTKMDSDHFGFFAVNMASTGTGKTFANAKIMRALSPDGNSLRYILALGLRTLTLQTGQEYRERIKLEEEDLAVLIGSRAVRDLFEREKESETGSESDAPLLLNDLESGIRPTDFFLSTVLQSHKACRLLYTPVLSCTIDHLMDAVEGVKGGHQILPGLRLLSSDLVIDEVDDFDGEDLIAIGRLIHLAAMLGRKVVISSATIPPDLAEGFFNVYQAGWQLFSSFAEQPAHVGCAWIDDNNTVLKGLECGEDGRTTFRELHGEFVTARLKFLHRELPRRRVTLISCNPEEDTNEAPLRTRYYSIIKDAAVQMHQLHAIIDKRSGKKVSFGVVRMANINPCIELTRFLLTASLPEGVALRTMAYHSGQVLAMRSMQENHLDAVLKRKDGDAPFKNEIIHTHLENCTEDNVIFLLVASPVEEVGRDHDFDWAVVEPSSFRSLIQLAGRVLRHRQAQEGMPPNIALLQYNLKGFLGMARKEPEKVVFTRPGYESKENLLTSHDLAVLTDLSELEERLDAKPRITQSTELQPTLRLADLEHHVIHNLLTRYEKMGPETMQGWLENCWWLTAVPQSLVRFRRSSGQLLVYLQMENGEEKFVEQDQYDEVRSIELEYGISRLEPLSEVERVRLWMVRDYADLLARLAEQFTGGNLGRAALRYGELTLPTYGKDNNNLSFAYSDELGLWR